ncbi:MAG: hypothetical protein KJO79_10710 [Verrucomicrobiae bacterium]|nr:hypothetical protein [Verrucomicrobiae bacterium]NNJ87645.1 hypothetical protein [Akkermansiaceae bacterium]
MLIQEPSLASLVQKDLDLKIPFSFDVMNGKNGFFNCLQIAMTHLNDGQCMLVTSADIEAGNDNLIEKACAVLLRKHPTKGFSYPKVNRFNKDIHYRFYEEQGNDSHSIIEHGSESGLHLEIESMQEFPVIITNYSDLTTDPVSEILIDMNSLYDKEIFTVGPVLAFKEITQNSMFVFVNSDNSYYCSTYEF